MPQKGRKAKAAANKSKQLKSAQGGKSNRRKKKKSQDDDELACGDVSNIIIETNKQEPQELLDGLSLEVWKTALQQLKMVLEHERPAKENPESICTCNIFQKNLQTKLQSLVEQHHGCCSECVIKVVVR